MECIQFIKIPDTPEICFGVYLELPVTNYQFPEYCITTLLNRRKKTDKI